MYCLNCGESWEYCICIPWCYEHDRARPCAPCARIEEERLERIAMLQPYMIPWYKNLWNYLLGKQ